MRSVDNTQHQGFAKGSWAATPSDLVSFTYLSDPTEITGRRERDITNARDRAVKQGGTRYGGHYTRVWGGTLLEIGANKHNGEVTDLSAIRESRNDVLFQRTDARTLTDEQLGRFRPRPDRPARQQGRSRLAAARLSATTPSRAAPSGTAPTTSATPLYVGRPGPVRPRWPPSYAAAGITRGTVAGGRTGPDSVRRARTRATSAGSSATIDARCGSRRVLRRARPEPRRDDHAGGSRPRRWCSAPRQPARTGELLASSRPRLVRRTPRRRGSAFFVQDDVRRSTD